MLIRQQRCKDWDPKIKVGTFERVFKPLQLGSLNGNRFSVALRFISRDIDDKRIKENVNQVAKHGFINYFGMQRFGQYNIHTHEIGRACLQQNWREVCRMLLQQSPDIDQDLIAKKKLLVELVFERFDMEGAISLLDRRDRIERALLMVLKKCYTQYYNAFQNISRNTRFIYVHAY